MLPGTIRALALTACGETSDATVKTIEKAELINEVERALIEVHNETLLEASKIVLASSSIDLKIALAERIRDRMLPVPSGSVVP